MKTAVILFAYKRPRYLKKCLASLKKAYDTRLAFHYYAYVDYSMMQDKVAKLIRDAEIFDRVYKREQNLGIEDNIKSGIYKTFEEYDAVIVLEDDLVLEPEAIKYLKDMLEKYEGDKSIGQVNLQGDFIHSHGWATWKDRWQQVCFDNIPLEGHLAEAYKKHGATWDILFHHNFNLKGWKARGKKLATHIGKVGKHYNILSRFSIRKRFREWNESYYRDKNILMEKESFLIRVFRRLK